MKTTTAFAMEIEPRLGTSAPGTFLLHFIDGLQICTLHEKNVVWVWGIQLIS